jgi:hypothetical protein
MFLPPKPPQRQANKILPDFTAHLRGRPITAPGKKAVSNGLALRVRKLLVATTFTKYLAIFW